MEPSLPKLNLVGNVEPAKCLVCDYWPCACAYILKLEPGGSMEWIAGVALGQMDQPFPHRAACPCPSCYSDRLRTWDEHSPPVRNNQQLTPSAEQE